MIKLLITDDSVTETMLLKHLFNAEKDMEVIGCAQNGRDAVYLAATLKPDLITMDIQMPIMDGYEATKRIMMENPVPIVVISSTVNNKELNTAFLALEAGAVSVIDKPVNARDPRFNVMRQKLISTIRAMAEIKVIRHRFGKSNIPICFPSTYPKIPYEIIGIGASVGGPQALKIILSNLPENFPVPIVIVQHMAAGFIEGFCNWLNASCALTVKCITNQEELKPGTVYFAPENCHLKVYKAGAKLRGLLQQGAPITGFCPSITVLFQSIAQVCGKQAVGILLTGMGKDGAQGLLELKQKGAHTLIQDKKSCVVFGMAGFAESMGAVDKTLELKQFITYFMQIIS